MNHKTFFFAGCALLIVGCKNGSTYVPTKATPAPASIDVKPGEEGQLLPLAQGNQWTFDQVQSEMAANGQSARSRGEATLRVAKVKNVAGGKEALLQMVNAGKVTNQFTWRVTKDGIFEVTAGLKNLPVSPPQPLAKFPLKDGEATKWSGTAPFGPDPASKQTSALTTKGTRIVDTDMGQLPSLLFQSDANITFTKGKAKTQLSLWLKPGTGVVKIEQMLSMAQGRQGVAMTLKSFTAKNP